jgi:hypothetical protein
LISSNTPVTTLSQSNSLNLLESYLRVAKSNQNAGEELKNMASQISKLKQSNDEAIQTQSGIKFLM